MGRGVCAEPRERGTGWRGGQLRRRADGQAEPPQPGQPEQHDVLRSRFLSSGPVLLRRSIEALVHHAPPLEVAFGVGLGLPVRRGCLRHRGPTHARLPGCAGRRRPQRHVGGTRHVVRPAVAGRHAFELLHRRLLQGFSGSGVRAACNRYGLLQGVFLRGLGHSMAISCRTPFLGWARSRVSLALCGEADAAHEAGAHAHEAADRRGYAATSALQARSARGIVDAHVGVRLASAASWRAAVSRRSCAGRSSEIFATGSAWSSRCSIRRSSPGSRRPSSASSTWSS
mmetsp:Transcript_8184/g.22638  ORF Transcript_8184/g.22638 Transcript_8184/m.22638 type:complete len:285 (+) Transcript_8184:132-986(+)